MVEPTEAGLVSLLSWTAKHSRPHIVPLYVALARRQIDVSMLFANAGELADFGDMPIVTVACDDIGDPGGPERFDPAVLQETLRQSRLVCIITKPPEPGYYQDAVNAAIQYRINVTVVESTLAYEGAWLDYALKANPGIAWVLWSYQIQGSA